MTGQKGSRGPKADRRLRQAYATNEVQMLPVCLFVRLPVFFASFPSNSIPSISHLQHSLRR